MIPEAICEPSSVGPASPATKLTTITLETKFSNQTAESPDPVRSELGDSQATSNLDADSPKRLEIVDYDEEADDQDNGKEVEHEDDARNNPEGCISQPNQPQGFNKDSISNDANNHDEIELSNGKSDDCKAPTISHRIELDSVSTGVGLSPMKKIKEDKERFKEMIIEGFAIRAFKTWEDLQDEVRESEILLERAKKAQQSDNKKPNPSSSTNGATSLSSTTKTNSKPRLTTGAKKSGKSRSDHSKQSSPSKGANSSKVNSKPHTNSDSKKENTKSQRPTSSTAATNLNDQSSAKVAYNLANHRIEQDQQHVPQGDQHPTRQSNHEKSSYPTNGYHTYAPQSIDNPPPGPATQHQFNPPANSNHFYASDPNHNQHRLTGPNYAYPRGFTDTHHDPIKAAQTYQYATAYNPQVGPQHAPPPQGPPHPPPIPGSQAAQQYFQQYHQFYRPMQYPSHPTYPALQNPYYAAINPPPSSAQPKGSTGHPQPIRPQPPPPSTSMSMPSSSSLAPPYNTHPYTVTDTVISRQTSLVPPPPPPPLHPTSMDYLSNGGYGYRYPQYPMQTHMIPHSLGQYPPPPSGYTPPAGRVRGFMGYDGSYPNFNNVPPPSYPNYMSHATIPKSSTGPPDAASYYNQFNRSTMNHLHQASSPNFGARGPIPYLSLRPPSGPPTIASYPPQ